MSIKDLKQLADKYGVKYPEKPENHYEHVCPDCGRCPTCGRRTWGPYRDPWYPNYPYREPFWEYRGPQVYC